MSFQSLSLTERKLLATLLDYSRRNLLEHAAEIDSRLGARSNSNAARMLRDLASAAHETLEEIYS